MTLWANILLGSMFLLPAGATSSQGLENFGPCWFISRHFATEGKMPPPSQGIGHIEVTGPLGDDFRM
jgi:hypothetical protein